MSAIQKVLADATEIVPSKRNGETITTQSYMAKLAVGVQELSDAEWNKLSPEVQDWFNAAADALESKTDIPEFPDMPKDEAAPAAGRRGGRAAAPAAKYEPKLKDVVFATTKRGKSYTGEIVELDDQGIVLDVDGKDVELDHDKIESIVLAGAASGGGAAAEPEVLDPEVSDTVTIVTKRGKTIMGNVTEITETEIVVVDGAGEIHEFDKDRLTSVTVKVKNAGKSAAEPAAGAAKGRAGTRAGATPAAGDKAPRVTAAANGGVGITARIRELMVDNLGATKDAIAGMLKKEGLEFKDATLGLTYNDTNKVIELLRDRKLID